MEKSKSKSSEAVYELTNEELTTKGKEKGKTSNEEGEKSEEDQIKLVIGNIYRGGITFMKGDKIVGTFEKGNEEEDNEGEEGGCSGGKDDDDDDNAGFKCLNCGKSFDDFAKLQRHKLTCLN